MILMNLFFFDPAARAKRTALWMGWGNSGVVLCLPPHSKERLAKR